MDAVESILRKMEAEQIKPTKQMLDRLFNWEENKKPLILEKKQHKF